MHPTISAGACVFRLQSPLDKKPSSVGNSYDIVVGMNIFYQDIKNYCAHYANGFANLLVSRCFHAKTVLHFFFSSGIYSQKSKGALFAQCDQTTIK